MSDLKKMSEQFQIFSSEYAKTARAFELIKDDFEKRQTKISEDIKSKAYADENSELRVFLRQAQETMSVMQNRIFELERKVSETLQLSNAQKVGNDHLFEAISGISDALKGRPAVLARAIVDYVKSLPVEKTAMRSELAKLAASLLPVPWLRKWAAFQIIRNHEYETGIAILDEVQESFDFSASEQRAYNLAARAMKTTTGDRGAGSSSFLHAEPLYNRRDFELAPKSCDERSERIKNKKLRVACIMDEFTFHSFGPECDLMQLSPSGAFVELYTFQPDFVFIESAWQGLDQRWNTLISSGAPEIINILRWCKKANIPTIFWNKEDPVHYSVFLKVARNCDYVFTTDIDCVPNYRKDLGHENAFFLPFAAQPKTHNPIKKYERKNKANFAGSYYLKYPQRQLDMDTMIGAVKSIMPVDIYDRNHGKNHSHYKFPDQYKELIVGSLPFSEIDKAYKGYLVGINMNTVKQSQSMFARRVFELMASNTIVVSNFSRAARMMFGDLIVSSDDHDEISSRLSRILEDQPNFRKFALLAMRKVLSEHTYEDRMDAISQIIWGEGSDSSNKEVVLVANAKNQDEMNRCVASFERQAHDRKALHIFADFSIEDIESENEFISIYTEKSELVQRILLAKDEVEDQFVGVLSCNDYYGPHYLTDIVLATRYCATPSIGKATVYEQVGDQTVLQSDGLQYTFTDSVLARAGLINITEINSAHLNGWLANPNTAVLSETLNTFVVDEFNYLRGNDWGNAQVAEDVVNDLNAVSYAMKLKDIMGQQVPVSDRGEVYRPQLEARGLKLNGNVLAQYFTKKNTPFSVTGNSTGLVVKSNASPGEAVYVYGEKYIPRDALDLELNSWISVESELLSQTVCRLVFDFRDEDRQKVGHQFCQWNLPQVLAIPRECTHIRIGFRFEGPGSIKVKQIRTGEQRLSPAALVARSEILVVTKQYPSYDDIYKYGFLHSRIRAYRQAEKAADVFRITDDKRDCFREFENVDIASGSLALLDQTLSTGRYKHVAVHMLDRKIWNVLKNHIDKIRITVWVHGAEIQVWQRREFEFERFDDVEIRRKKRLSDDRRDFWRELVRQRLPNLHLVFVSKYFKDESNTDLNLSLEDWQYSVIHNFIDHHVFPYQEKSSEDRLSILSIRPYASRKYANDISVKAVELLKDKPFFSQLMFSFFGDGDLFDETLAPIQGLPNVRIHRGFLTHDQIAEEHKKHGIFLTPTRMDAQGVSRDEAMSSGLVPITTNVTAIPEFVDSDCGMLVEPEDAEGIADAIEALYNDPDKFLRLSENASKRVARQSGLDSTIKKELSILSQRAEEEGSA